MLARVRFIFGVLIYNLGADHVLKDSIGAFFLQYFVPRNSNICSMLKCVGFSFCASPDGGIW